MDQIDTRKMGRAVAAAEGLERCAAKAWHSVPPDSVGLSPPMPFAQELSSGQDGSMGFVGVKNRRINPVLSTKSVERPKFTPVVVTFDWHREWVSAVDADPEFSGVQGCFAFERLAAETAQFRLPLRSG